MKTIQHNFAFIFYVLVTIIVLQINFSNPTQALSMTVSNYSPADDSSGAATNNNLSLTFNRAWITTASSGSIQIKEVGTNNIFESYDFPAYPANITGEHTNTLTINPTANLSAGTSYYVTVSANIVMSDDTDELHFSGFNDNATWNFSTQAGCYNPPSCIGPCFGVDDIEHLSPPDGAHFMQTYEGLAIVFGSTVTVGVGDIRIRKYSDDSLIETIDVTGNRITGWGTNTLNIDLVNDLASNTHYYVNLDLEGWSLVTDKDNWDFWTKSTPNTFSGSGL